MVETSRSILVLGGTGAIGIYLVPELVKRGYRVDVTSRGGTTPRIRDAEIICGDGHDPKFLEEITTRKHYDAIVDFLVYSTQNFKERYQALLTSCEHYCFLSSYRVFADSGMTPITERSARLLDTVDDPEYLETDEYGLAKARQEDLLRSSRKSNWTIFRPSITYSTNRFQLGTLEANTICYRAMLGKPVIMSSDILTRNTTMTWAGDVARLMATMILNPLSFGEDYNVVTHESSKWADIASIYRETIGLRVTEVDHETYVNVVGNEHQVKYDRMFHRVLDNTKILAATGMKPAELLPVGVGLRMELETFKKNPVIKYPNDEVNRRMDLALASTMGRLGIHVHNKVKARLSWVRALKRKFIRARFLRRNSS